MSQIKKITIEYDDHVEELRDFAARKYLAIVNQAAQRSYWMTLELTALVWEIGASKTLNNDKDGHVNYGDGGGLP